MKCISAGWVLIPVLWSVIACEEPTGYQFEGDLGSDGVVLIPFNEGASARLRFVSNMTDGRIVTAGTEHFNQSSMNDGIIAYRFLSDGTRDLSFGTDGEFRARPEDASTEECLGMHVYEDGSILILSGHLLRLTPEGKPDTSFGDEGWVLIENTIWLNGLLSPVPTAFAVRPDGRIVISVLLNDAFDYSIAPLAGLIQLMPDGTPDTSFGSDGLYWGNNLDSDCFYARDMELLPDGRIAVLTEDVMDSKFQFILVNENGDLDSNSVNGGVLFQDKLMPDCVFEKIGLIGDRIFLLGSEYQSPEDSRIERLCVQALELDGRAATGFGEDGTLYLEHFADLYGVHDVLTDEDNNLVMAVGWNLYVGSEMAVLRMTSDGLIDTSFGDEGVVHSNWGKPAGDWGRAYGLALQPDGAIVVVGERADNLMITRISPD